MATTVSFTSDADTALFQNNPDGNLGGTTMVSGTNQQNSKSRAIFSFDLSSIPANANITDATVTLAVTRRPDPDQHGGPIPSDFGLYRMLVSWGEGTGTAPTGSPTGDGATWSSRFFPLVPWDFPGGNAGTDYVASASTSALMDNVGIYVLQSTPQLIQDVTTWVSDPSANFGYMLISDNEYTLGTARRFASKETASAGFPAPTLSVTYDVPEASAGFLTGLAAALLAICTRCRPRQALRPPRRII